jgi:hypothetical protein
MDRQMGGGGDRELNSALVSGTRFEMGRRLSSPGLTRMMWWVTNLRTQSFTTVNLIYQTSLGSRMNRTRTFSAAD